MKDRDGGRGWDGGGGESLRGNVLSARTCALRDRVRETGPLVEISPDSLLTNRGAHEKVSKVLDTFLSETEFSSSVEPNVAWNYSNFSLSVFFYDFTEDASKERVVGSLIEF